jgi:hypothetical protein
MNVFAYTTIHLTPVRLQTPMLKDLATQSSVSQQLKWQGILQIEVSEVSRSTNYFRHYN